MTAVEATTVWLTGPGEVELRGEQLSAPVEGELLCETIVSALSPGTEIAAWQGLPPLRPSVVYPRLQGYCHVGRVIASGSPDYAPGDRVLSFTSHRSHVLLPVADVLYRLPADADASAIACAYLYHLGYNAVLRSKIRSGSRVLVIGLGALGLTSVAMAAIAGADVFAISDQASSAVFAERMGARTVFGRDALDKAKAALGVGADVVISTVNGWSDWQTGLRLAAPNGVIAMLGFPGRGEGVPVENPLASEQVYMKQLRIEAVGWSPERDDSRSFLRFNERANLDWIARMIAEGRIDPSLLISGRYAGTDIATAYTDLAARKNDAITYVLDWAE
ncbi:zinc-dependent alcohol dehydrogenase [Sphingopyxis sp.]|uniref:zinc-dependent alcohol dehydrogenase n=1 Tax=Sphingopyxis sp. TaxID=1908224 RepID=UPI003F6EBAB5